MRRRTTDGTWKGIHGADFGRKCDRVVTERCRRRETEWQATYSKNISKNIVCPQLILMVLPCCRVVNKGAKLNDHNKAHIAYMSQSHCLQQ